MGNVKLSDILLTPLRRIQVPGGDVLHALKKMKVVTLILEKHIFH